jgi:hypothetical protein
LLLAFQQNAGGCKICLDIFSQTPRIIQSPLGSGKLGSIVLSNKAVLLMPMRYYKISLFQVFKQTLGLSETTLLSRHLPSLLDDGCRLFFSKFFIEIALNCFDFLRLSN